MPLNLSMTSLKLNLIRIPLQLSSLLLGIILFSPLKLLGAESSVAQTQPTVPASPASLSSEPETQQPAPQTIPQTQQSDSFDSLESPRNYLSGKITSFASDIDRFFGGDRHYQESNQSVVQMDITRSTGYGGNEKFDLSTRLNLRLPVSEGQFRLLLETDPEKILTDDPENSRAIRQVAKPVQRADTPSVAAALRYEKMEEKRWFYSTDAGVQFHGIKTDPDPFARARGSYSFPLGQWRVTPAETLFLFKSTGAGTTTQLDFERIISVPMLFRSTSNVTWLKDTKTFYLRQDVSVFHTMDDRTALLYQVSASGVSNPHYQVTDYVALLLYRYRLHREWLFLELSPQLHFPKAKDYAFSPAFSMRLEILFNDSR